MKYSVICRIRSQPSTHSFVEQGGIERVNNKAGI